MNIAFNKLDEFNGHLRVFEGLKENEQLWLFGNRICKSISPYSIMKDVKNPLLKAIRKISALALRFIFCLGRVITRQSEKRCLSKVERLAKTIKKQLNQELAETDENHRYILLEKIQMASKGLHEIGPRFDLLKKTYHDEFFGKQLNCLKEELGEIHLLADKKADETRKMAAGGDEQKVQTIFAHLQGKKRKKQDFSRILVTRTAFETNAAQKYGRNLVATALQLYSLQNKAVLNGNEVAALLVGMVTQITMEDLKEIYCLSKGEKTEEFDELAEEALCDLLDQARDISYTKFHFKSNAPFVHQLKQDQLLLSRMKTYKNFSCKNVPGLRVNSLKKYAYAEFLGKHIPYGLFAYPEAQFASGILLNVYEEGDKKCLKQAETIVAERGIYVAALKPAFSSGKKKKLQVLFRGTFCTESLYRDLNPLERALTWFYDGPGRASFEKACPSLIQEVLEKGGDEHWKAQPILEVIGHSLGACDAQRFIAAMAQRLKKEDKAIFSGIKLFAFNSPNVEPDICRRFAEEVNDLPLKNGVDLKYFKYDGDGIQEAGVMRLGYFGSDENRRKKNRPKNLRITIAKFNLCYKDRIADLGRTLLRRFKLILNEYVHSHMADALKSHCAHHENESGRVYIEKIITDAPEDIGLIYGDKMSLRSERATLKQLDDSLLTHVGRLGRKIKRQGQRISAIFFRAKREKKPDFGQVEAE